MASIKQRLRLSQPRLRPERAVKALRLWQRRLGEVEVDIGEGWNVIFEVPLRKGALGTGVRAVESEVGREGMHLRRVGGSICVLDELRETRWCI